MGLTFRSVALSDADAVCSLWATAGLGAGRAVDRVEIERRLHDDDGFFVLACQSRDSDNPIGVVMGCYDGHRGWLKRVAVDPAHQGQGIGQALVAEVERRFVESGITKMRLSVWSHNEGAGRFWEARGYEELQEIRYFVKDLSAEPAVHLDAQ